MAKDNSQTPGASALLLFFGFKKRVPSLLFHPIIIYSSHHPKFHPKIVNILLSLRFSPEIRCSRFHSHQNPVRPEIWHAGRLGANFYALIVQIFSRKQLSANQHFKEMDSSLEEGSRDPVSLETPSVLSFQYPSLSNTGDIRLLTLLPGKFEEKLSIILRPVNLELNSPPYQALSYAWGAEFTEAVFCDGKVIKTPLNLALALRYIRSETELQVLWADSICIVSNTRTHSELWFQFVDDILRIRTIFWNAVSKLV